MTNDAVVFGKQLVVPNIGAPISRRERPKLTYFFTVVSAPKSGVQARLELAQGGQILGTTALTLPGPDEHGTIRYAGQLPAAQLATGAYNIRIVVTDGKQEIVRETPFTLVE